MLNMGRCFAWFFESRSYLAHLGTIIALVVNSFLSYICMSMTLIKTIIMMTFGRIGHNVLVVKLIDQE